MGAKDIVTVGVKLLFICGPQAQGGGDKLQGKGSFKARLGLHIIFIQKIGVDGPLELLGWNDYLLIQGIEIFSQIVDSYPKIQTYLYRARPVVR